MAAKKKAAKAAGAAVAVKGNPYIQRIVQDEGLRDNLRVGVSAAREAYGRLSRGKTPAKALKDKKLQKNLREAATAMSDAASALREGPKKKKKAGGLGAKLLVVTGGAGLALALSEGLRNKVLDTLFGAEEEFEYTPTTTPPSPAPDTVAA